jgi:serine/threonine protein kinase
MLKPLNRAEVHFEILSEIGADGRNSKTYVARDHQLDAEIVIKQVLKSRLVSPARFFDESKALYASAHPNVVQIHYACQDADHIYLAMPYYRRGSLKPLITNRHITVRQIITFACQVASALHNIHSKGLIHFDVKPDNVLLSDRGEALLSDFGLARPAVGGVANPGMFYTPMVPPEAPAGATAFSRTWDVYQLGLTLYRMCNGNQEFRRQMNPFLAMGLPGGKQAFDAAVMAGNFPDRQIFPAHIPQRIRNTIRKCLKVDPAERQQSVLDVANELAAVDDLLDWQFAEVGQAKSWTRTNEAGTTYEFTVNPNGSTEFYQCSATGKRRRVNEGFKASMNDRDIRKLLGSY